MAERVALSFRDRNPDVLTSIANLSSDEVFTPPQFANQMLDSIEKAWAEANSGAVIWEDPNVKFLDPFTKSGVFLREITRRLTHGLKSTYPDLQERVNHITRNQVFGIAVTRLTSLLARRSVYCSKDATGKHSISRAFKNPEGNVWFEPLEHTWEGGSTKVITADKSGSSVEKYTDGRCKYCRGSQKAYDRSDELEAYAYALIHQDNPVFFVEEIFGADVKFDVIIGNPPYQLSDGEDVVGASPIYNLFVEQAKRLEPRFLSMVIPARWYSGGKGLDGFRQSMLVDKSIRLIEDFPDSTNVFPGTQIKGGVCYFLWDRDNKGLAKVRNNAAGEDSALVERPLLEPGADVFIRYNLALPILKKVMTTINGETENWAKYPESKSFKPLVSVARAFGFRTYFQGSKTQTQDSLKIYQNGGYGFVSRAEVERGKELVDSWKIFVSSAYGAGESFPHAILGKPFIGAPGTVCTETYTVIGPFSSEQESRNALSYFSTRLFRFLVLLHKPTQHATQSVYTFAPKMDFSRSWVDEDLYAYFGLSLAEVAFVESMVRPMELDNE